MNQANKKKQKSKRKKNVLHILKQKYKQNEETKQKSSCQPTKYAFHNVYYQGC